MNTRDGINTALGIIGENGFDGYRIEADGALPALIAILAGRGDFSRERVLAEIKRQKLAEIRRDNSAIILTLTPAGALRLQRALVEDVTVTEPAVWDKRWRMVTFDIPVDQSKQRVAFTKQLRRMGFVMLQRSLWVHAAPSFEQASEVARHYNLLRYCTMFEVVRLDKKSTGMLSRHFSYVT